MQGLLLVLAVAMLFGWSLFQRKTRLRRLPDISDEDFLREFSRTSDVEDRMVLAERKYIAELLGIPTAKLQPQLTFDELSKFAPLIQYNVAVSDLESEISKLFLELGHREYTPPRTIGELINEILKAKTRIGK